MGKNILVFYSNKNSHGKKDATGAFIPEAKAFAKAHDVPKGNMVGLNLHRVSAWQRRHYVLERIRNHEGELDAVAFFGHGWPHGMQFGFGRANIPALASVLKEKCHTGLKVVLYACLTAENNKRDSDHNNVGPGTDGGFADELRDEMVRLGIRHGWVDAHKTAGHTTWNPFVTRFHCRDVDDAEIGAKGGSWIIQPRSAQWKTWVQSLRNQETGMRYNFPFMEEIEVAAVLAGVKITYMDFTDEVQ